MVAQDPIENSENKIWYFATIFFIIIDYARPQELFPAIGTIRPMLFLTLFLGIFLLKTGPGITLNNKQINILWLFVILLACYIPFARNNYYAYKTALSQLLYMPFILSVIYTVNTAVRLRKLVIIFIGLMIYIAVYSIFHQGRGPGNYFGDENDLSLYINMWLPFCYFLLFVEKRIKIKILYLIGFVVGFVAVIVSFSRGGFVGLLAMSIVAWWFSKNKIVILFSVTVAVAVMAFCVDSDYWIEMATVTDISENTASERIESWKSAWNMFSDNLLGVGGNNFQVRFPEYQTDNFTRGMWGRVSHSLWFTLIPELGIVGICLYLSLLWTNIKDIFWLKSLQQESAQDSDLGKYYHYLGVSFIASLAGFFASATFLSVLYYAHYWYLTGLIVASVRVAKADKFC